MNLYLLQRSAYGWDEYASCVVAAVSPAAARKAAQRECSTSFGHECWLTPRTASLKRVGIYIGRRCEPHVIHDHFHAG